MNEAEWYRCTTPARMLDFLNGRPADATLRKFACACCRRIWDLFDSDLHRKAIEVAERFADGAGREIVWVGRELARPVREIPGTAEWAAMIAELEAERAALDERTYFFRYDHLTPEATAAWTLYLRQDMPWVVSRDAARLRAAPYPFWRECEEPQLSPEQERDWEARESVESAVQCDLLRCVVGNPFRKDALAPIWPDATVMGLAIAVKQERALPEGTLDNVSLGVLADALEDAGCTNSDILDHLRAPGPHVHGCWAVDLLLAKV